MELHSYNEIALQEKYIFLTILRLLNAKPAKERNGSLFASATLPFHPSSKESIFLRRATLEVRTSTII
jgi:hypothetical protein